MIRYDSKLGARVEAVHPPEPAHPFSGWLIRFTIVLVALCVFLFCTIQMDWANRWSLSHPFGDLVDASVESLNELDCNGRPCFVKAPFVVREDRPGFPSYWNYANQGPINVSYDKRSFLLNGHRALFLSGSMHPVRATPATWLAALDEAVHHGLNMITIYVFWGAHQPFPGMEIDWSLPGGDWDLAWAIRAAANRGLFIHARIGPYACGEYNYGGIPEWVAFNNSNMAMRRPNQEWMDVMETFVNTTVAYLTRNRLWAHQGGPILMGQIENELGGSEDMVTEYLVTVQDKEGGRRTATMQDYADWSGEIAARAAPEVVWTMCNGLTAPNTINTCNGYGGAGCSTTWLESNGQTGRIQVDQPALWTEAEGGFQIWGETASNPTDYFWGRTARDMARDGLKWFARGGTHLNYYMWWGGYNRGRSAAAGIANWYASDAVLCPNGQRRHPKFGHLREFHEAIMETVPVLLTSPSALNKSIPLRHKSTNGEWVPGDDQRYFVYFQSQQGSTEEKEVFFVENDADKKVVVAIPFSRGLYAFQMEPLSAALFVNRMLMFDSGTVNPRAKSYRRQIRKEAVTLLDWSSWEEPVGARKEDPRTMIATKPIEHTALMMQDGISSDFAWYETTISLMHSLKNATLFIDTQKASVMSVFVDGELVGSANDHHHAEGSITLSISWNELAIGSHSIAVLSESLGYFNLIGRWGASTKAKKKGITGDVRIAGQLLSRNRKVSTEFSESLVDGRQWRSRLGLNRNPSGRRLQPLQYTCKCMWHSVLFDTPHLDPNQALLLDISIGRGRIWLNGFDLGRYWNITRGDTQEFSQRYYHLPLDTLYDDGNLNELLIFNAEISNTAGESTLVVSWTEEDETHSMEDEVDFPSACI